MSGVYEIKNILNDKRYVGSSIDIYKRFMYHKYSLLNGNHRSIKLQRAWNKYGEISFEFNIIEECEPKKEMLLLIEQKYLDLKPEYNILYTAGTCLGCKRSDSFKRKQSNIKKGSKPIRRLSEVEYLEFKNKHSEWAKSSEWVNKMKKAVLMLNKETGEIIREFDSAVEAAIFLGRKNKQVNISYVCLGKRKSAFGYKWLFKNIDYVV